MCKGVCVRKTERFVKFPTCLHHPRRVDKRYRALLCGRLEGSGTVDLPLAGKACESRYHVVGHCRTPRFGGWMTVVDLWPHTGRKHQLRQHMAALGGWGAGFRVWVGRSW